MKRVILVFPLLCAVIYVNAEVRNVPGDYSTIQEAIDAAVDADTVLVAAGTYTENINFNGKSIVLGSMYIVTGDTSCISATILDESENGSVVEISSNEDSTTVLSGFTIRNGKADYGGGVYVEDSYPRISNCRVINNTAECSNGIGGGVFCTNSSAKIQACEIAWNAAIGKDVSNGWGGLPLLEENPEFIDTTNSNFRLDAGSPCIDAGTNDITECDLSLLDLWSNPRICDGDDDGAAVIEMRACEPVGVTEDKTRKNPESLKFLLNYPNPFNAQTEICFTIEKAGFASLYIYDISGRIISCLEQGVYEPGIYRTVWTSASMSSGLYICRLHTEKNTRSIKIFVQK